MKNNYISTEAGMMNANGRRSIESANDAFPDVMPNVYG